jgi:thiol-disulfide isomerase/thioredoxin
MIRLVVLLLFLFVGSTYSQEVKFINNDLNKAIRKAKKENKLIFVDGFTTWCGPCKWMDANVFVDPQVSEFFNTSFINVKINLEEGNGIAFAEKYAPQAYPTFYFLTAEGAVQHMALGAYSADDLMLIAKGAIQPKTNLAYFKKNHNSNLSNGSFLLEYAMLLKFLRLENSKQIIEEYLATQTDLSGEQNSKFIYDNVGINIDDRLFKYMVDNLEDFYTHIGRDKVDTKLLNAIHGSFGPEGTEDDVVAKIQELLPKESQRLTDRLYLNQLMANNEIEDITIFTNMAYFYTFQWKPEDWEFVNNLAWIVYELGTEEDHFKKGKAIALESVALDDNYFNNDTVAALCYMLKDKESAMKYAYKAIELANEARSDASSTHRLMRLIQELD